MTDTAAPKFPLGMRGYDRAQVDSYVRSVEEQLDAEHARSAALAARLDESGAQLAQLQAALDERELSGDEAADHERLGRRVSGILRLADEEAAELRASADAYEAATREAAEEQARHMIGAAEARAEEVGTQAATRADASDAEGRIVLARTRDEAERIVAGAHEQARVVHDEWRVRHEASMAELSEVLERRDRVLTEIERMRDALGGVRSAAGVPSAVDAPTMDAPTMANAPAGATAAGEHSDRD